MTLRGTTGDFPLEAVVGLIAGTAKTGELLVRGSGKVGALGFAGGRLVAAMIENEGGENALGAIFAIPEAAFEFTPWASEPEANLEPGDLASVLKRAADARDRLEAIREAIPDDHLRFKLSAKAADQGTVTLTPARWRALLMVDGERDVLSIATLLGVPRMDALSVLAELVKEGVVETLPRPMHAEASMPPRHIAVETPLPPAVTRATEEATRPAASEPAPPATSGWPPASPRDATTPGARGTPLGDWVLPLPSAVGVPPETPSPPATGVPPPTEVRGGLEAEIAKRFGDLGMPSGDLTSPEAADATGEPTAAERRTAPEGRTFDEAPRVADIPPEADKSFAAMTGHFMPGSLAPAPAPPDPHRAAEPPEPEAVPGPEAVPEPRPISSAGSIIGAPWSTPAAPKPPSKTWGPPAPTQEADALPPPRPAHAPAAPAAAAPPAAAPERKSAGLFGRFLNQTPPAQASPPARAPGAVAGSPIALAAFSNALLLEYNSGSYGKARVESRMANLLMRVDEQADPIDRPLPIVDDLLDTAALERESLAEEQAVPYIATLVRQIYEDAERAFGKDKAKKGYKAARQQVFGGDANVLNAPDLADKLPRV